MKNLPPMRALAAVLFALFLTALASVHGAQSVVTSIKYNDLPILGNVPACYKPLTIQLTITDMAAAGCSITFQGVAGSVVSQPTAYGGIMDATKVQVTPDNSLVPPRLTVANISGSTLTGTGTIEFEVALTGCELFPPESTATPPPITFLTTSPCGTVLNAAPVDVDVPIIQLVKNPVPYSSHDNEPFLMNEVVKRYYKVEATRGVVDFFTLDLTPEPHITITAIDAYNPITLQWVSLYTATAPAPIKLVFRSTQIGNSIEIASLGPNGPNSYLEPGDYILFRETLKITGCTDVADPPTSYKAAVRCDENITAPFPCWLSPMTLNVHCVQKNTSLSLRISDKVNFSQSSSFPSISVCDPNASGIDYVIFLKNTVSPGPVLPSGAVPPVGAGVRALDTVGFHLNGGYFTFGDIYIGATLLPPVCYTRSVVPGSGMVPDRITVSIDFKKFKSTTPNTGSTFSTDPDGPGGLTDLVGNPNDPGVYSLGTPLTWNLLPEGEHVAIVLKDFRFIGQNHFTNCVQPTYSLDNPNVRYLTPKGWDMCHMQDGFIGTESFTFAFYDSLWEMRNAFKGFSLSSSDVTDIAPGTQGQADSANLTFKYIATSPALIGGVPLSPFTLSQRNGMPELIKCPNLKYQAVVTLPPGFSIAANGSTLNAVTITDPFNASFAPLTISATVDTVDSSKWIINYTGIGLLHPAQAQLTFKVDIDCNYLASQNPPILFGFALFPMEFRAICDSVTCSQVYRVFSCTSVELFFHCPGLCTPAPPVGTKNFLFKRITPGWLNETDFETHYPNNPNGTVDPAFANQVYECELIEGTSTMGYAKEIPQSGLVGFEVAYDPPPDGNNPLKANIFHPEPAIGTVHKVNFTFIPQNGTPGPQFTLPMANWEFKALPADKDVIRIYPDVSIIPPGQTGLSKTAEQLLQDGDYQAEFVGQFRVKDENTFTSATQKELPATYYKTDQVRGNFIVVDKTPAHTVIAKGCDSWGARQTFLKTVFGLERSQFITPHYNVLADNLFPVDQCYLRYVLFARASGGFLAGVDFPKEYKPLLAFPNHIRFRIPAGYTYVSADYAEGTSPASMGTWNPFASVDVSSPPYVDINNIHSQPGFRSIEKTNGLARQAIRLTLIRECPLLDPTGPPIYIEDFDITTRAYSTDAVCNGSLLSPLPTPSTPHVIEYKPTTATEQNILTVKTEPRTVANVNPITLPLQLLHSGGGRSLSNVWMYFTVQSGHVNSITPTPQFGPNANGVFGPTVSGLYHVAVGTAANGVVPNTAAGISGHLTIDYDCSYEDSGDPNLLDEIVIQVHVGNNCYGYPTFDPVAGTFDVAPCFTEKAFSFAIQPKKSIISVEVDSGMVGNCGQVVFNLLANSDGANATDVLLNVTPPPGYTLDPSLCKMGPTLSIPIPPAMLTAGILDVSAILLNPFAQNYFSFDLTAAPYNPLAFRLVYRPGCNIVPGVQDFSFSITGKGSCGEDLTPNEALRPITYSPQPTIICPQSVTVSCASSVPVAATNYASFVSAGGTASSACGETVTHVRDVITPNAYDFLPVTINGSSGTFTSPNGNGSITATTGGAGPFLVGNNTAVSSQFPNLFGASGSVQGYVAKADVNATYTVTFDLQNYTLSPFTVFGVWNITEETDLYKIEVFDCSHTPIAPPFLSTSFNFLGWDDNFSAGNLGWYHATLNPTTGNLSTAPFSASGMDCDAVFWDHIPPTACKIVVTGNLGPLDDVVFYFAEPACANRYTITRIYKVADACGNFMTCDQTITVSDQTPPMLVCSTNVIVEPDAGQTTAVVNYTVMTSDDCPGQVTLLCAPPVGFAFPCGATTVLCVATDACGNTNSCPFTVTVLDRTPPTIVCPFDLVLCSDPGQSSRSNVTYIPTVTDNCPGVSVACNPSSGSPFFVGATPVTCTATDAAGNTNVCSFLVTIDSATSATPLSDLERCHGELATFATAAAGTGPFTYAWTLDGSSVGTNGATLTVLTASLSVSNYQIQLIVTGACGAVTNQATLTVRSCATGGPCSVTQGFYGNRNGKFNGTNSLTLVGNLLAQGPLRVGKAGSRSLSILAGDAALLQQRMPSGGTATNLPNNGDQTLQTALLPLNSKSNFANVLLGQTITLSLNCRLSTELLGFGLTPSFCTQGVLPGPDGLKGTADDVLVAADVQMFTIPSSVLVALSDTGLGIHSMTVQGLLELANRGLAAQPTGSASLADINAAVDAINRGFDECRTLVDCSTHTVIADSFNDGFTSSPILNPNSAGAGFTVASEGSGVSAAAEGLINIRTKVANLNATKDPAEPDHAGNAGGKSLWWRWRAPKAGVVTIQTEGSSFDTLLAVYTGSSLSNLTLVASNDDTNGLFAAEVTFPAQADTDYQIAVDGFDGASGSITLTIIIDRPRLQLPVLLLPNNQVQLSIQGELGRSYTIEASTDLVNWTPVASAVNASGTLRFADPGAQNFRQRFYRGVINL